ncbi:MAG: radical SAM protein [Candidatus Nealsonbacteria bacterium]
MKIFILNPSIYGKKKSLMGVRKRQPLSLAYIASLLRDEHEIVFLDANALDYNTEETVKKIKEVRPDILILTSSPVDRWECPNSHIDSVFEIIDNAQIGNTVLIGSHGSATPDWLFGKCRVKFIVRGEPELIVTDLVVALRDKKDLRKVSGISFRENNKIFHNSLAPRIENLDSLPFPAYDLLPMDKYSYTHSDLPQPFSIMFTSRGCPFSCIFCLKIMMPGKYIVRTPENIIEEIKYLIDRFGIRSVFFQDWEFLIDKERVRKICGLILKNNLKFEWGCNARLSDIEEELVAMMKKAGCCRINIGLESGSQKILNQAKKGINVQDLERVVKILRENQVHFGAYGLLNLPGETSATIKETAELFEKNEIQAINFNLAIPYFGTELFEKLRKNPKNQEFNWENIEDFAGRVEAELSPFWARFYLRHFKFRSRFGRFYFLNPRFYQKIISRLIQ